MLTNCFLLRKNRVPHNEAGVFPLLIFGIILISIFLSYFLYTFFLKGYKISIQNFWSKENRVEETKSSSSIKNKSTDTTNKTHETDKSLAQINESSIARQSIPIQQKNYTKPLTLKIYDICSGKLENVFSIAEGTRKCLNLPSPYDTLLEKNSTHIITSILNESGFNETFEINDTVLIYFLFAEDVATISKEIDKIYLDGSEYFYLGDYELQTIWEADSYGNLYISKMIVILPLYVKKDVEDGNYTLTFYLNALNKDFYLGKMNLLVRSR
jgi:hypothetical protein